jgi:hypothetical protein
MAQPIYQTLEPHLCSQSQSPPVPNPTPGRPSPSRFIRNRRRRICLAGAGAVGGGGQVRRWCSAGRTANAGTRDTAHLGSWHLLAPGGRSAVYPTRLRPFLARRLHGTLARQRLTPPSRPVVISFIYSLTLLTVPLESLSHCSLFHWKAIAFLNSS